MSYQAKAIANEFLKLAKNDNCPLTQMKLQKLIYIAHGYHLAILNMPLISNEIQAWQYGPIIPDIYQEFKIFGNTPINVLAIDVEINDDFDILETNSGINKEDTQTKELIDAVWGKYSQYSGPNLSDMTHRVDTPWDKTYSQGTPSLPISNGLIAEHYKSLIEE